METKPGGVCGHRETNGVRMRLGSCILLVLSFWSGKEGALQGTALNLCVSPASSHGIQIVSLCLVRMQGVKLFFLCKLSLINPFHQLQIYLLNPIKNMNMQIQTFFNTHFQGLGVRLDYSIPVNSL